MEENSGQSKNRIKTQNNNSINQNNNIITLPNSNTIKEKVEKRIIQKISILLTDICDENAKQSKKEKYKYEISSNIKPFISKNIPQISIKDYLERLCRYSKINFSTVILILVYIDRLCNMHKFKLTYFNIHKLILGAMIIAIKYNEDEIFTTKFYSKLGGVSKTEICFLEYNFISLIDFKLYVSEDLFKKYNDYISSSDSDEDEEDEDIYYDDKE